MAGAGDIRAGGAFVELYADAAGVVKGIIEAKSKVEQWQTATARANKAVLEGGAKSTWDKIGDTAVHLGVAVAAVHGITSAMRVTTMAMRGDWEGMNEAIKHLPLGIGAAYDAWIPFSDAVSDWWNNIDPMMAKNRTAAQSAALKQMEADAGLIKTRRAAEDRQLGLTPSEISIRNIREGMGSRADKAAAIAAILAADAAEKERKAIVEGREQAADKAKEEAKAAADLAAKQKKYIEEIKTAAKAAADERDADNERFRRESYEGLMGAQMNAAEAAILGTKAAVSFALTPTRGFAAGSAAALQSVQISQTQKQMAYGIDRIANSNQKILDEGGAKFN